jgi:hypothetical protein
MFVACHGGIALAGTIQNPQSLCAIGTASSFTEIFLRTQSGNFFRYCHIDKLVESHAFQLRSFAQFLEQRRL